jgi:hypothetical protein
MTRFGRLEGERRLSRARSRVREVLAVGGGPEADERVAGDGQQVASMLVDGLRHVHEVGVERVRELVESLGPRAAQLFDPRREALDVGQQQRAANRRRLSRHQRGSGTQPRSEEGRDVARAVSQRILRVDCDSVRDAPA